MRHYIGLLHQDGRSDYTITIPDLPGCTASGHQLCDAVSLAASLVALQIARMIKDRDDVPEPSSFETIMKEHHMGVFILVPAKAP